MIFILIFNIYYISLLYIIPYISYYNYTKLKSKLKLYSRYIFKKTLIGFAGFSSVFILLIWFSRAIPFVKYITENGIEISQFFYLFVLVLPWLLLFIVPISLFAAILLIYNRLIPSNEITILKNSGLTKFNIGRPIISLAIFSSLFCYFISLYAMPYANKKLRVSRVDFQNNYANLSIKPQTFENLKNLTIYVQDKNIDGKLFGILLHDDKPGSSPMTITAESGSIFMENDSALLYMDNGTIQKFDRENKKSDILNFDSYVFNLTSRQEITNKFRWKPKERYINELINPENDSSQRSLNRFRSEIHKRFTYPLLPIVFSIIALTCILRDNFSRKGNMSNIVLAVVLAISFLSTVMMSYDLIVSSPKYTALPYFIIILFSAVCLYFMNRSIHRNNRRKNGIS